MAIGKAERTVLERILEHVDPEVSRASFLQPTSTARTPEEVRKSARLFLESWVVPLVQALIDRADGKVTARELKYGWEGY